MEVISKNKSIEQIEAHMMSQPQVECPVIHHFGPGIYIREVTIPSGAMTIGHKQKLDHLNIMLTGKAAMIEDGKVKEMAAPQIFNAGPGRKVGYIIEDCTWLNVYSTDETDIEKLEDMLFDKSETWQEEEERKNKIRLQLREEDRADFVRFLGETGIKKEVIREQSENETDYQELDIKKVSIRNSEIDGKGIFATYPIRDGDVIGPARVSGFRTQLGRFVNHSGRPNAFYTKLDNGDIILTAKEQIYGCIAGGKGDEITVDYRESLKLHQEVLCQE
jgi:hypothetical protein